MFQSSEFCKYDYLKSLCVKSRLNNRNCKVNKSEIDIKEKLSKRNMVHCNDRIY